MAAFRFMAPDDPLGRNGPSLDNFLRIRSVSEVKKKPECPYGETVKVVMLNPSFLQFVIAFQAKNARTGRNANTFTPNFR